MVLANSLEYPERIQRGLEGTQLLKRLSVCSLFFVGKFSNFSLFHPSLIIQYSTEEYKAAGHRTHKTSLRVKKMIPESMPCIVARSTRRYIGTALRGALYSLSYLLFVVCCKINDNIQGVYHRPKLELACNVGCRLFLFIYWFVY